MKKLLLLITILVAILAVFVSCSDEPADEVADTTTKAEATSITIVIDRNSFSDSFDEDAFYDELDDIEGLFHTKNDETNQYTLTMTETAFSKLKESKSKPVTEAFNSVISDSENFVTDIKYDEDFRKIKVFADTEKISGELSALDETLLKIMASAMAYQLYTVEGQSVEITVVDFTNEEVITTVKYPLIVG